MGGFFAELKRRQMFRVAAAYAVVAWLILQVVNNLAPGLNLPNWAITLVIVLLGAGFPVALLFCWIQQLAPGDGAQTQAKVNRIDWILAGGLILVIALLSYQQLAPTGATTVQGGAGLAAQTNAVTGVSIAVLPLANLSGDAAQEFFSDGMTDEITSALAKVRDLRVVGRSSAFQFKGQNKDLRAIGEALSARFLIDGSVRRAGDRVRITAQLIEAGNGVQLWSENYDRQLTDVFAIQEDIAQAIAGALRVPLGLQQGQQLVANRTSDLESYQQFLRARALYRAREIDQAIALLEPAVARAPNFAPAWALLAQVYTRQPTFGPNIAQGSVEAARPIAQSFLAKAEMAAREAIRLDPEHAGGYAGLAVFEAYRGKRWSAAEDLFRQALALDPNDADTLHAYSNMLADTGYVKESLVFREQLRNLEPFVPVYNLVSAQIMLALGQREPATRVLEAMPSEGTMGFFRNSYLARAYAVAGRYREAADTLQSAPPTVRVSRQSIEDAARLLRSAPQSAGAPETLPLFLGNLQFVYVHVGAPNRALEFPERLNQMGFYSPTELTFIWAPEYAPLRKTERFKALVRAYGFPDYWRAKGWADLCRPVGADDFVCD